MTTDTDDTDDTASESSESSTFVPVQPPPIVYAQIEALRRSGVANMYQEVFAGLDRFGFTEGRKWVEANREPYLQGLLAGLQRSISQL